MAFTDFAIVIIVLLLFFIIIYNKLRDQTIGETLEEIKDSLAVLKNE